LSPNVTAKEVTEWKFDKEYTEFFQKISKSNIPVIFRTMHEMNGWWYPRSSDPENFKKAWIHIRELSRKLWLDKEKIAFDFSVNHYWV
jgi:beta-mannanase